MSAFLPRLLITTGAVALGLSAPTAALADPGGDPAGNNGTIKIQPYGGAAGHANHPHPGCDFRLQLWGFDDDQTGTITFSGQAPTADAVTKQPLAGTQRLLDRNLDEAPFAKVDDLEGLARVRGARVPFGRRRHVPGPAPVTCTWPPTSASPGPPRSRATTSRCASMPTTPRAAPRRRCSG